MGRSPGTVPARQVLPVAAVENIFYQCINISLIFIPHTIIELRPFQQLLHNNGKKSSRVELSLVNTIFLLTHHRP